MWSLAMTINSAVWALLFGFLTYSFFTLFLEGNYQRFLLALVLWGLSNLSEVIFACLA